jgi:hypothetical protein
MDAIALRSPLCGALSFFAHELASKFQHLCEARTALTGPKLSKFYQIEGARQNICIENAGLLC